MQLANLLCNGNYAVSGDAAACDAVMAIAKPDFKARMTIRLAVAGAFHTDFMLPAVEKLKEVLDTVDLQVRARPLGVLRDERVGFSLTWSFAGVPDVNLRKRGSPAWTQRTDFTRSSHATSRRRASPWCATWTPSRTRTQPPSSSSS